MVMLEIVSTMIIFTGVDMRGFASNFAIFTIIHPFEVAYFGKFINIFGNQIGSKFRNSKNYL